MYKSVSIEYVDPNMARPVLPKFPPLQSQCWTTHISNIGNLCYRTKKVTKGISGTKERKKKCAFNLLHL